MTILDLFKTPKLRKYTLIFWYSWIVNALVYYGLSLNMSDFGGNIYITFLLSGLVELPALLLCAIALRYIGRKKLFSFFMLMITVSTLAVIPSKTTAFKVTFVLLGKFFVSSAWCIMKLHIPEVFPTVIRHIGIGSSSMAGRFGSIAAPFMKNFVRNNLKIYIFLIKFVL
jgi:OCT family organic cation transporter-like MFS transporter 4/5